MRKRRRTIERYTLWASLPMLVLSLASVSVFAQENPGTTSTGVAGNETPDQPSSPDPTQADPQTANAPKPPLKKNEAEESTNDDSTAQRLPTADEVLRRLQRKRPSNVPIAPASLEGQLAPTPKATPHLLPEGHSMNIDTGTISQPGRWWTLSFEPSKENPTGQLRLLPCSQLEQMVTTVQNTPGELSFRIQGEVTVFQEDNYLLPGLARLNASEEALTESASQKQVDIVPAEKDDEAKGSIDESRIEDVFNALRNTKPTSTPLGTIRPESLDENEDQLQGQVLLQERQPISMRLGRLLQQEDWYVFIFESDHPDAPEPRMRVLPCRQLDRMIDASAAYATPIVFVVSGEVTVYKGENYFLPRVARRYVDSRNFEK